MLIELILLNFYNKHRINDFRYHLKSKTEQKQKATATAATIHEEPLFSRWFNTIFVYNFIFFNIFSVLLIACRFRFFPLFLFFSFRMAKGEKRRTKTCTIYRWTLWSISHKATFSHSRIIEWVYHRFAQDEGSRTLQTHFIRLKSDQKPKPSSGCDERVNPIKTAYAKVHENKKKLRLIENRWWILLCDECLSSNTIVHFTNKTQCARNGFRMHSISPQNQRCRESNSMMRQQTLNAVKYSERTINEHFIVKI